MEGKNNLEDWEEGRVSHGVIANLDWDHYDYLQADTLVDPRVLRTVHLGEVKTGDIIEVSFSASGRGEFCYSIKPNSPSVISELVPSRRILATSWAENVHSVRPWFTVSTTGVFVAKEDARVSFYVCLERGSEMSGKYAVRRATIIAKIVGHDGPVEEVEKTEGADPGDK